jgi:tetratricopeptide (TPR) repeat protein
MNKDVRVGFLICCLGIRQMFTGARDTSNADRRAIWLALPLTVCLLSCQSRESPSAPAAGEAELVSAAPIRPLPPPPSYNTSVLPAEAGRIIERLLVDFPNDAEAMFGCAWIFNYFWRFDEAERCCLDCLALDPSYTEAHEMIAQVKERHGDFEAAADHLRKASEVRPELRDVPLKLGAMLLRMGQPKEALPVLEDLVLRHSSAQAWFYLGQSRLQLRDYAGAKDAYERSLEMDKELAGAWFGLTQTCERLGETERAQQCRAQYDRLHGELGAEKREARIARTTDREAIAASLNFASRIYARVGKWAEAEAYLRRAVELVPHNAEYHETLARALIGEGRVAEAVPVLESLRNLKPRDMTVLFSLADLHSQLNDRQSAKECLRQITVADPDNSLASAKLAQLYLNDGEKLDEARRLVERATRIEPTGETWYLLSAVCLANQDRTAAKYALIEALRLDPRNPKYLESGRILIGTESQP